MLDERRPAPPPPRPWVRRNAAVLLLAGLLLSALGVVLSMAFLADEAAKAYGGGFDEATWSEPDQAQQLGLGRVQEGPLGLPVAGPETVSVARVTDHGAVEWTLAADGSVTMVPANDDVTWPEAKAAYEAWAEEQGLPAPRYGDLRLVTPEGEALGADRLL